MMPDPRALLRRLLGPREPELSCEDCFEHLDRYVEAGDEGERQVPGMGAHLEGCAACREDYESLRDLVAAETSPG
jgi:hypothetical protein